jgi:hypothetical protein
MRTIRPISRNHADFIEANLKQSLGEVKAVQFLSGFEWEISSEENVVAAASNTQDEYARDTRESKQLTHFKTRRRFQVQGKMKYTELLMVT